MIQVTSLIWWWLKKILPTQLVIALIVLIAATIILSVAVLVHPSHDNPETVAVKELAELIAFMVEQSDAVMIYRGIDSIEVSCYPYPDKKTLSDIQAHISAYNRVAHAKKCPEVKLITSVYMP